MGYDYYWIGTRGSPVRVYCNMNATSGNLIGGWMRVAYVHRYEEHFIGND